MNNKYEIRGDAVVIFLKRRNGEIVETIIDVADLEIANSFSGTWCVQENKKWSKTYVQGRTSDNKYVLLHRWLFGDISSEAVVDHINHNSLDNRRTCNLRTVTTAQNAQNRKGPNVNNKSGIRNVGWQKSRNKWMARITIDGKIKYLGTFDTPSEAEQAVITARKELMPYSTS